jgi:hypothetical protein
MISLILLIFIILFIIVNIIFNKNKLKYSCFLILIIPLIEIIYLISIPKEVKKTTIIKNNKLINIIYKEPKNKESNILFLTDINNIKRSIIIQITYKKQDE